MNISDLIDLIKGDEKAEDDPSTFLADFDGWITWHGGLNPVPGKKVLAKYRGGDDARGALGSETFVWGHGHFNPYGAEWDIVKYKIVT